MGDFVGCVGVGDQAMQRGDGPQDRCQIPSRAQVARQFYCLSGSLAGLVNQAQRHQHRRVKQLSESQRKVASSASSRVGATCSSFAAMGKRA